MPGSRIWCPDEAATLQAGVRLIVPDRPGVGGSAPRERMTLADVPADVEELAGALGLSRFAVVGVSAGGSYAASCAALIPSRLTNAAIVSSAGVAKYNWGERPGTQETWSAQDRAEFDLIQRDAVAGADLTSANFAAEAIELEQHPELIHEDLAQAEGDRWFFTDPVRVAAFDAYIREAWRQGFDALKWTLSAIYRPWGFRLADISIPIRIFHGSQDPWVTEAEIEFQTSTIPRTSLVVWPDSGHLGFVKHWGEIMTMLGASPDAA
jgi:pimeloyl-ACP methyl ester carboxylesterase